MDGYAVGHLVQGVQYRLTERFARYLIVAGYAVAEPSTSGSPTDSTGNTRHRRADD